MLFESRHRTVVNHFSPLVAPWRVNNLAHRDLPHVACDHTIDEPRRVLAGEPVLEQRRNIDQRRGVANRVVLMFVMRFVRTDGVVTGPLAIAKTLAELKRSFVKCGSDRHDWWLYPRLAAFVRASDYKYAYDSSASCITQTKHDAKVRSEEHTSELQSQSNL